MRVLKFGGSSMGSPEIINEVIKIITDEARGERPQAIAVSAYQGVTNALLALANECASGDQEYGSRLDEIYQRHKRVLSELMPDPSDPHYQAAERNLEDNTNRLADLIKGIALVRECSPRLLDEVVSFGEMCSASALAATLNFRGYQSQFVDSRSCILTDSDFGQARVNFEQTNPRIVETVADESKIYIFTGFIAQTADGKTTTLGRGGTDYTAAIVAAALKADLLEIWTDVDGVLTTDPRRVSKAFPLREMSYKEAMELCHFGAKVIFPPTLQPAMDLNIPVKILNTFNPSAEGTLISEKAAESGYAITGISSISGMALIRLQGSGMVGVAGIAMRLFRALASSRINVVLITQASSEHTICIAVQTACVERAERVINEEFRLERRDNLIEPAVVETGLAIVSVVGEQMRRRPGISGKVFGALGTNGINIIAIAQGSSELNISAVVKEVDEQKALLALHDEFFFTENKTVNIFMAGSGLVGSALLRQIASHKEALLHDNQVELKVVGLANSKGLVPNPTSECLTERLKGGASFTPEDFQSDGKQAIERLMDLANDLNLPNSVFVDCTASDEVANSYDRFLNSNIAVITSNKRAQTDNSKEFFRLRRNARDRNVPLLYETSVGAGLPVISTLRDLLNSGDVVLQIEAVLSGTLSYLFNSFDGSKPFSQVVREARELGFTEPDPREDLSGADVARKILILARECGSSQELEEVNTESLIPQECANEASVEEFLSELANHDSEMEKRLLEANRAGNRLCYIATFDGHHCRVEVREIDHSHPFFALEGSDNIISFVTDRYRERPLVVKGPGAGAEVTAAGVLADIVRVSQPLFAKAS